ncbi:MAG: electron transport complex subunit RsxA [Gammaproteobacteria bacterium]|nr:electron transport complex subunit RsxA [Gammaproteobacteria bacterium]
MTDLLLIAVAAATVNNFVLVRLLGLCPVLGAGTRLEDVPGVALGTTAVLAVTAVLCQALDRWVLVPFGLPYLRIIGFLALTLLVVRLANLVLRGPARQLPLITTNCAVLGVALLTTGTVDSLAGALALGLGAGTGFSLVLLLFTGALPRIEQAPLPRPLRGPAIALVTIGMLSMAFLGFSGVGT